MPEIRVIDKAHEADIRLPNEPFPLRGRLRPAYSDGRWSYDVLRFPQEETTEMCFPDEGYDFDAMADSVFLGAYEGDACVGLAVLQPGFFRYMYVLDLKVSAAQRGRGVGRALISRAAEYARSQGWRGLYLQGQDNNLDACLFYLAVGFRIGGLDTEVYRGTKQEGKSDILFYLG